MKAFVTTHPTQQGLKFHMNTIKWEKTNTHTAATEFKTTEDSSPLQQKAWCLTMTVMCTVLLSQSSKELLV